MRVRNKKLVTGLLVNGCRLLLALTFILSGFVKANDPYGTVYKIQDYLTAVNAPDMPRLALLTASIALAFTEFTIGVSLLFGISRRPTARLTTAFLSVMTLITLYLFIFNPISDCGCFGDVIILTNGQTLAKNIILLAAAIVITKWHYRLIEFVSDNSKWLISTISMLFLPAVAMYNVVNLPTFDFSPYKTGTDMKALYDSQDRQQFDVKIVYERNGETMEIDIDDEEPDSTWTYVETRRERTGGGEMTKGALFITDKDGYDLTREIFTKNGYTFLLSIPDLTNADEESIDLINEIYDYSLENGYDFYCLTGSEEEKAQTYWSEHTGAEYDFYFSDERELKTFVRSSPGLVLLKDGVIIHKWSNNNLPDEYTLTDRLEKLEHGKMRENSTRKKMSVMIFMFIGPLLILTIIDRLFIGWRFYREMKRKTKELNLDDIDRHLKLEDIEKKISGGHENNKRRRT